MVSTLLLDANNYGALVGFFEGLLAAIAFLGLLFWLWSRHIEQQFDREPKVAKAYDEPRADGMGGRLLLYVLLLAMGLAAVMFVREAVT